MKKAFRRKKLFIYILVKCLLLINIGCGIDVFLMIDSPANVSNKPEFGNTEYKNDYFEFYTNETGDTTFIGTSVYYKIYDSTSTLSTEVGSLTSIANDVENNYNAPYKLIDEDKYNYKQLLADGINSATLIPYTGKNRKVYIRLSDYLGMEEYSAQIKVDDLPLNGEKTIPLRDIATKSSFNFTGTSEYNKIPASDDVDTKFSSTSQSNDVWYVAMFAVAVGKDTNYTPVYSNILYLGAVTIDKSMIN